MEGYEAYDAYDGAATAAVAGFGIGTLIFSLALSILLIVAMWKMFEKAGEPGWKSIVPFLNTYILFKISWGNGWLFLLCFVPLVNAVIYIIMQWKLCKSFGKGVGFFILMLFLPFIAWLMLGFGSDSYSGPQ